MRRERHKGPIWIRAKPEEQRLDLASAYQTSGGTRDIVLPPWALHEEDSFTIGHELGHTMMSPLLVTGEDYIQYEAEYLKADSLYREIEATIWQIASSGRVSKTAKSNLRIYLNEAIRQGLTTDDFLELVDSAISRVSARKSGKPLPSVEEIRSILEGTKYKEPSGREILFRKYRWT